MVYQLARGSPLKELTVWDGYETNNQAITVGHV